jgi:hypothetical protein
LDSITDKPKTLYNMADKKGFSRLMMAAKLPRAFWSTSEEAIHSANDSGSISGISLEARANREWISQTPFPSTTWTSANSERFGLADASA